ncbi:hypothetical protein C8Q70DRAFT_982068 [Cubamyces menziesii]|nr:hypothetical protein C8Q70DRAFT_982068 [Cubamyces menziesii]
MAYIGWCKILWLGVLQQACQLWNTSAKVVFVVSITSPEVIRGDTSTHRVLPSPSANPIFIRPTSPIKLRPSLEAIITDLYQLRFHTEMKIQPRLTSGLRSICVSRSYAGLCLCLTRKEQRPRTLSISGPLYRWREVPQRTPLGLS